MPGDQYFSLAAPPSESSKIAHLAAHADMRSGSRRIHLSEYMHAQMLSKAMLLSEQMVNGCEEIMMKG